MKDDDWALVVGINKYPDAGVNPLEGASGDARRFREWLLHPKGGNLQEDRITLLTSPGDGDPPPDRPIPAASQVRAFFEQFMPPARQPVGRRLYIYLSGHGISAGAQQSVHNAALLLANARKPEPLLNFAGSAWAEGIRGAAHFREVMLIMDCCSDIENTALVEPYPFGFPVADGTASRLVLAHATGWGSKARELVFPGENGDKKQGAFTRSLLAVLGSGRMSGAMLKASVEQHLALSLADQKKAQEPQIQGSPDPNKDLGRIVFNEAADPPAHPDRAKGPFRDTARD